MKILHVIDDLSMGGGQNLLIGLAGRQSHLGHNVTVLQLKKAEDQKVTEKIESKNVKVDWLTVSGSVYNPLLILKLIPRIRMADIVHVHLFPALYWTGFARLMSFCKVPIVYTEHSTKNKRRANPILKRVDSFVYKHCYNQVIACADKALETYLECYPNVGHVCAINNGVDTILYRDAEKYSKKELLGIPEDCFVVTMVARFMFMKRQDTIVKAIASLPQKFHACFVGGKSEDQGLIRVKDLAKKLGVEDRIHFLYLRSDVPQILKSSDAIIMSSEYEGLSLSSIEGMAARKPFIATNVTGLKEIIKGAGILFELDNSAELSSILLKLESDNEYYNQIAKSCAERAELYNIQNMVDQYMHVYETCIKK